MIWPATLRVFLAIAAGVLCLSAGLGLVLAPVVIAIREVLL